MVVSGGLRLAILPFVQEVKMAYMVCPSPEQIVADKKSLIQGHPQRLGTEGGIEPGSS